MSGPFRWSFIAESGGAPAYYRAQLMARGLNAIGETAIVWPASIEHGDGTIRGWRPETGEYDNDPADVLVCRLFTVPSAGDLFIRARRAGQIIAFDLDDDVWSFGEWNPRAADARGDQRTRMLNTMAIQVNMACADVIVASTPALAEVCATVMETIGEPDVPVAFVRSSVVVSEPAPLISVPPRVGWMGTWRYRGEDLSTIEPALRLALADDNGILRHLGRDRVEPPLPVFLTALDPDTREPPYAVHESDWCDIERLPELIRSCDLGVIPMTDHRFQRCRSATTGLAFAACGVPFIASPRPEYEALFANGIGLLADTPEDWSTLLKDLLGDVGLRTEMGRRGREACATIYTPEESARRWVDVIGAL